MNPKIIVVALALLCGGCASRAVPDAANDFKEATADFTKGLSAIDADAQAADLARENALALQSVGPAETITVLETCRESVLAAQKQFDAAAGAAPYNGPAADKGFTAYRSVTLCGLTTFNDTAPKAIEIKRRDPSSSISGSGSFGKDTLSATASALDAYVKAILDVTANTSGAKADTAREGSVSAFGALAEALGAKDGGAYAGVIQQVIASAQAADRNKRVGDMLTAYDAQMPTAMERIGHAGRLRMQEAIRGRAEAAQALAARSNILLKATPPGGQQALLFEALEPKLDAQNQALRKLRSADPMAAAQAFATAHHDLVEAYRNPKASHAAVAASAKAFSDAAQKLSDALKKD